MKFDISDIIRSNGASMELEYVGEPPEVNPTEGCDIDGDISLSGRLTNNNGILHLDGDVDVSYISACYRCLCKVKKVLKLKMREDFISSVDAKETDMYPFEGKTLDISKVLNDNIVLNLPMKHLCSDLCKGLCSKCGGNMNDKPCGCVEDSIDPRLEGLNKFFEQS
jgi:uncharacterized protein